MTAPSKALLRHGTNDQFTQLLRDCDRVWAAIGADAEPLCEGDNECAVEFCIDADRLLLNADAPESNDLVRRVSVDGQYTSILKWIGKNRRYV